METLVFLNFGIGTPEIILIFVAGLPFILTLVCLVDIIKSDFKDNTTKLLWVVIVLLAPVIGSILYLLLGRKQKTDIAKF